MKTSFIKIILMTILFISITFSQSSYKLVQLTPELGDTIDAAEMKDAGILNLNLFKGFQRLVFYIKDDTTLVSKITYEKKDGRLADTTIFSEVGMLNNLRLSLRKRKLADLEALDNNKPLIITTKDGQVYSGVIANVDDSGLMLLSRKSLMESDSGYNQVTKRYFEKSNLSTVFIEGKSEIGSGISTGALGGFVIGAIIGLASGDDTQGWIRFSAGQKALMAGIGLGVTGTLVGLILGLVSSSSDEEIIITDEYNLAALKKYIVD